MAFLSEDDFYGTEAEQIWDTYEDYMNSYIGYYESIMEEIRYDG